jgi:hypothetical protein
MSDLFQLARPFPDRLVKKKPGKFEAAYVEHSVITQRLLEVLGPHSFQIVQEIRSASGTVVGCIAELSATIDGTHVIIREAGDVERPSDNDASNLKSASSDAYKRCAMRIGCGLHLWSGDNYYLDKALTDVHPE